ncbi:methyltransferase [Actinomadura sp. 6N118]|uniref:methyltransferase n=1 Tax=Actinomadura sp. 6N118 TaxID=3375151 RepID=UPI0037B3EF7B
MRLAVIPDSPQERQALEAGMVPTPLFETQFAFTLAQVVMVATQLGVFDALATGPATAAEVAECCQAHPQATGKLLLALAGSGYVRTDHKTYELTAQARTWLVRESPQSLADKMVFQFHEWDLMAQASQYVRTGQPVEFHERMNDQQWAAYQRGMRALATAPAQEAAQLIAVPAAASTLLDIGGSHGYYSVALCRRHPGLRAEVLDLPEAIKHAAPLLAAEQMGDRITHREGDALHDDLGDDAYDVVLLISLAHHLTAEHNRALAARVARALRPGGVFAVMEPFRTDPSGGITQLGALTDFYFGLTSRAGTWSADEIAEWQRHAGLEPAPPTALTSADFGIQTATKHLHQVPER